MRHIRCEMSFLLGLTLLMAATMASADGYRGSPEYEVTITNVTKGQVFSPPVLVTHKRSIALFEAGAQASAELAMVAEDGNGVPLANTLSGLPQVFEAQDTSAPIPPGMSATYLINGHHRFTVVSVVAMLVNTNDAFLALDSERLPLACGASRAFEVGAYDAGTEVNNESATHIPGPVGNNPFVREPEGNLIAPHAGVQGGADLDPDVHGWEGPVARITIERID